MVAVCCTIYKKIPVTEESGLSGCIIHVYIDLHVTVCNIDCLFFHCLIMPSTLRSIIVHF